jgi:hypothetical protein
MKTLNRRDFLGVGAAAAALATSGNLPLLAASSNTGVPYSVVDYRTWLKEEFQPASGSPNGKECVLTYKLLRWNGFDGQKDRTVCHHLGDLVIQRKRASADEVGYQVTRESEPGAKERLTTDLVVKGPIEKGLASWRASSDITTQNPDMRDCCRYAIEGSVSENRISWTEGSNKTSHPAERPVHTEWTIPDLLAQLQPKDRVLRLDFLENGSTWKPDQTISFDGAVRVPVVEDQEVELDSYLQMGYGVLPTHYLVDRQGLTQFVTVGLTAWALAGVTINP